jgi:uncharacterized protein
MKKRQPLFYFRLALLSLSLVVPLLSLVALGSLWLWQHGYVLYWAIGACSFTLISYGVEKWLFGLDTPETATIDPAFDPPLPAGGSSPREQEAWSSIIQLSNSIKPAEVASRDNLFDLGVQAIETVAKSMHPGEDHALWKFTLPEALLLTEQVSAKLSTFVRETIPLGDRLTVGQFLRIYRWKSAIGVAEQVYDIWRIVRLLNPAAAAAQEVREQLTRRAYDWGREELARRILRAYVREVGRAAIDLYSGRMSVPKLEPVQSAQSPSETTDRAASSAPSVVIAGLPDSGAAIIMNEIKRIAVNDAPSSGEATTEISVTLPNGNPASIRLGFPGSDPDEVAAEFSLLVDDSSLLVWAVSKADDNEKSRTFLRRVQQHFAATHSIILPTIVCSTSHLDRPSRAGFDTIWATNAQMTWHIIQVDIDDEPAKATKRLLQDIFAQLEKDAAKKASSPKQGWRSGLSKVAGQVANAGRAIIRKSDKSTTP